MKQKILLSEANRATREERQAEALRANLRRRKEQQQARASDKMKQPAPQE